MNPWKLDRLSDALEEVVGLAVVDPEFADDLLDDPLVAVRARNLVLNATELRVLDAQRASDLPSFARGLLQSWGNLCGARPTPLAAFARAARPAAMVGSFPMAVGGG